MKTKIILLSALIITFISAKSQIEQPPNDTFQTWTISTFAPDFWCTYSSIAGVDLGLSFKDNNTSDSYYGGTSVKLVSDSIPGQPAAGVVGSILSLGSGQLTSDSTPPSFTGIPFGYRPDTVYAIYLYSSPGADMPNAYILMTSMVTDTIVDTIIGPRDSVLVIKSNIVTTKNDTTLDTLVTMVKDTSIIGTDTTITAVKDTTVDVIISVVVDTTFIIKDSTVTLAIDTTINTILVMVEDTIIDAGAYLPIPISGTTFTLGVFPITGLYLNAVTPDTLLLQFNSSSELPVQGSTLILSQAFFGYVTLPTGLQELADKMDFVLYPNPSSNQINISSADNAGGYKIIISDMAGNLVYGGALHGNKTSISAGSFASGIYIYRIADPSGNILKQDKFIVAK